VFLTRYRGRGAAAATLALVVWWHSAPAAETPTSPLESIVAAMRGAEQRLQEGQYPQAEARYGQALADACQKSPDKDVISIAEDIYEK